MSDTHGVAPYSLPYLDDRFLWAIIMIAALPARCSIAPCARRLSVRPSVSYMLVTQERKVLDSSNLVEIFLVARTCSLRSYFEVRKSHEGHAVT